MKSPKRKSAVRRRAITPADYEFGRKIAALRKAAELTQEQAAATFGVSEAQYGKYERGETPMRASFLYRIKEQFHSAAERVGSGFFEQDAPFMFRRTKKADVTLMAKLAAIRSAVEDLETYIRNHRN